MNCDSFILFAGGAHYAAPNALAFLFAILAGAAAERIEQASRKNSRFWFPTALGAAVGLAVCPLLLALDFRIADKIFLFQYAAGGLGGFLGASLVKARKKKEDGDAKSVESAERSVAQPEKKSKKTKEIAIYALGLFCFAAAGDCGVKIERWMEQVSHRRGQLRKFNENCAAFQNAFERGAYDEAFKFACACEEAGRDWPDNEMYLGDGRLMKAQAAEMAGDYDVASASYAAYKAGKADVNRGSVVTAEPRLTYKRGNRDEAFRGYCDLFALEEENSPSGAPPLNRLRFQKTATSAILLSDYAEKDRVLSPFAEYADFLTFMETEFKAQDEPTERAETMNFFRSLVVDAPGAAGNVEVEESDASAAAPSGVETTEAQTEATPK